MIKDNTHDMENLQGQFLERCDILVYDFRIEPFTMVIFGGAGDLSKRKLLPTIFHLYMENELPNDFSLLGLGLPEMDNEHYRTLIKEAIRKFTEERFDEKKWNEFGKHLFYLSGPFDNDEVYKGLYKRIDELSAPTKKGNIDVLYYMAVPPNLTPVIVNQLKSHNLSRGKFNTRIIVEKPFGRDRKSAIELNNILIQAFDEPQVYRIDHYLGKETVQNIIFFRFSNSIFEPLWNRRYIDHVQITVAENLGIEHRGLFYDQAGVVRDIMQNHIMQLIGLVAMEPPVGFEADFIRDEKVKILRSIRIMDKAFIEAFTVRGQYGPGKINGADVPGYREEKDTPADSNTPTFIAAKLLIDNWRWAGIPFYIRTGKRLGKRITEIVIQFKQPPLKLFGRTCDLLDPNLLVLSIQPEEKICLRFGVKYPKSGNEIYPVNMEFGYQDAFGIKKHPPYERLLMDSMKGDLTLFVRQDGVEAMWAIVDPIIAHWENNPATDFPNYLAGSWGPQKAHLLMEKEGRKWRFASG